jgi:hypothetical protein
MIMIDRTIVLHAETIGDIGATVATLEAQRAPQTVEPPTVRVPAHYRRSWRAGGC